MPLNRPVVEAGHGDEAHRAASPVGERPEPEDETQSSGPTEAEHYASHLKESTASMFLHTAMAPLMKGVEWPAFRLFRDQLLSASGSPTDPIEVMLLEQLALAHFCTNWLAAKTTNAGQVNVCGTYASAYARIMGEFRRSSLALQAYRHANRQLDREPAREMAAIDSSRPAGDVGPENETANEQVGRTEETDAGEDIIPYPEPASTAARAIPSEAASAHAGGSRKAARRRAGGPAVGAVHRAAE